MCDINDKRKSRRKQCAPSRHSNIGTATVISILDDDSNATNDNTTISNGVTVMKQDRKNNREIQEEIDCSGLLECEQYLLQQENTDPVQRLSPSTASSTSSLSTSIDSNSLSFDAYRHKEMLTDQCINPMHALYLPIAFHNHSINSVQVLGYPQVLIPVAIHPHAQNMLKPCLFIDEFMARNITVPNQICLGETRCLLTINTIQQAYSQNVCNIPSTSTAVSHKNNQKRKEMVSNDIKKRRKLSNDLKPLDLTVRIKQIRQNAHSSSSNCDSTEEDNSTNDKLISSEMDKKYRCDCGVSFNSEITLNGHKKYYCHNNANQIASFREPQQKVAYHCQQCDFLPLSASQLAQHVRVNHATIQAYVCQICGYKGYSQRGIRSHLRTHTEYANEKPENLINSHVHFITAETKTTQCSSCHKNK
ncbi:Zinc finger protein [Dirofilaria immitis]